MSERERERENKPPLDTLCVLAHFGRTIAGLSNGPVTYFWAPDFAIPPVKLQKFVDSPKAS